MPASSKALVHSMPTDEREAALLTLAGLTRDPGSSRTGSLWLCLDFPKTNICLASPVRSRNVLNSKGGRREGGRLGHSCSGNWRREERGCLEGHPSPNLGFSHCLNIAACFSEPLL